MHDLAESDRRFRLAFSQAPLIAWTTDADLVFTWGVGGALGSVDLDAKAFARRRLVDFFPGEGESSPEAQHRRALAGQRVRYELEWMGRSFDVRLEPLRDSRGDVVGVAGVALDFTERKQAEQQLRLSEDRFVLLGRATSDMAWDWDLATDSMWRNENLQTLFGYAAEDMEPAGSWWELKIHPDDRQRVMSDLHSAIARGDRFWSAEYRWRRKDGSYATVLDRGYVLPDEHGNPVRMVGSTMDITKRRREESVRDAIYRISEAAVTAKDLPSLYREVHRIVGGLMPAQNFYIALFDPGTELLSFPYFVDEEEPTPEPYRAGRGLTEYVLRSGKPFYASTEGYEKLVASGEVVRIGPMSIDWVGVPLTAANRTIGVLVIQTYTEGVRYGEEERDILGFVSEQIAMAIERKRTEEALRSSEEHYRLLFQSNPCPMWVYDYETLRFLAVNDVAVERYGYSRDEFLSMTIKEIRPPEDVDALVASVREPRGEISHSGVWRHRRKDGTLFEVEITSHTLTFAGRPAVLVMAVDITDRRRDHEALRRSETRFRILFEAAADAILLVRSGGIVVDANPAAAALVDSSREALLGTNLETYLDEEDLPRARAYLSDRFHDRPTQEPFEVVVTVPSGARKSLAVRSRLIREPDAAPYVEMLIRDVTEQREMQHRLVASERLASVGQMAAYLAHEINTPLANISLLAAASKRRTKDPEIRERLEKIDAQRRQAASIISDLLSFSKHRDIQPVEVDLRTVLVAAVDAIEPYRTPEVTLLQEYGETPVPAFVDPVQIQEVFVNLLRNAFEATSQGTVTVRLESRPGQRTVVVSDTGHGIPEDVQKHLFQPFVTSKRHKGGTGLGLALSRNIVSAHGGEIHFTTTAGHGTTFTVVLPQKETP